MHPAQVSAAPECTRAYSHNVTRNAYLLHLCPLEAAISERLQLAPLLERDRPQRGVAEYLLANMHDSARNRNLPQRGVFEAAAFECFKFATLPEENGAERPAVAEYCAAYELEAAWNDYFLQPATLKNVIPVIKVFVLIRIFLASERF